MSDLSPNSSAFWSPTIGKSRQGKKVRADAVLKNLCPAAQEQIAQWSNQPAERDAEGQPIKGTGGVVFATQQLAEIARQFSLPALRVSSATLYEFLDWWRLEQDLEISFAREEQVMAKTGDKKKAREAGETLLMRLGLAKQDGELIEIAARVSDSRRGLDQKDEIVSLKRQQVGQKGEQLKLEREKFKASIRTKLEAGLDALFEEIKGNTRAETIFAQLREAVAKA